MTTPTAATTHQTTAALDALLHEERRYPPSPAFTAEAKWRDPAIYEHAEADPEGFWAEQARRIDWLTPFDRTLEWHPPWAKWFVNGQLHACANCVDRHARSWRPTRRRSDSRSSRATNGC
jgi:acetyl-CoA synthetase